MYIDWHTIVTIYIYVYLDFRLYFVFFIPSSLVGTFCFNNSSVYACIMHINTVWIVNTFEGVFLSKRNRRIKQQKLKPTWIFFSPRLFSKSKTVFCYDVSHHLLFSCCIYTLGNFRKIVLIFFFSEFFFCSFLKKKWFLPQYKLIEEKPNIFQVKNFRTTQHLI